MSELKQLRSGETTGGSPDDLRQIEKWSRRYAQSRTLGFVVFQVLFLVVFLANTVPPLVGVMAYRNGWWTLYWICVATNIVGAVACVVFAIYFTVPRWGGKFMERLMGRLYSGEGTARLRPRSRGRMAAGITLAVAFGSCILGSVLLGFIYGISEKYMQPISAIYVVPFMVGVWFLMRPAMGWMGLLWPLLYAVHAILIVAGAPIAFEGPWSGLNMIVPMCGYGIVLGLIGHMYSRFALRKLRRAARSGLDVAAEDKE